MRILKDETRSVLAFNALTLDIIPELRNNVEQLQRNFERQQEDHRSTTAALLQIQSMLIQNMNRNDDREN